MTNALVGRYSRTCLRLAPSVLKRSGCFVLSARSSQSFFHSHPPWGTHERFNYRLKARPARAPSPVCGSYTARSAQARLRPGPTLTRSRRPFSARPAAAARPPSHSARLSQPRALPRCSTPHAGCNALALVSCALTTPLTPLRAVRSSQIISPGWAASIAAATPQHAARTVTPLHAAPHSPRPHARHDAARARTARLPRHGPHTHGTTQACFTRPGSHLTSRLLALRLIAGQGSSGYALSSSSLLYLPVLSTCRALPPLTFAAQLICSALPGSSPARHYPALVRTARLT